MLKVLVIDGQGGGVGKSIVSSLVAEKQTIDVCAIGTSRAAALNMKKAGAVSYYLDEVQSLISIAEADVITGPIGIVVADSLKGEVTSQLAKAVADSKAVKVLVPLNRCNIIIAGVAYDNLSQAIVAAVEKIISLSKK